MPNLIALINKTVTQTISLWRPLLGLCFLGVALSFGCTSFDKKLDPQQYIRIEKHMPAFAVQPLSRSNVWRDVEKNKLQNAFTSGLGAPDEIEIIPAASARVKVRGALTEGNLLQYGSFNREELAAIGSIVDCKSIVAVYITDIRPYAPQRVAMDVLWLETDSGNVLFEDSLAVDLGNYQTRADYEDHLGNNARSKVRKTLLRKNFPSNEKIHASYFSNREFWRFVGLQVAQSMRKSMLQDGLRNKRKKD